MANFFEGVNKWYISQHKERNTIMSQKHCVKKHENKNDL